MIRFTTVLLLLILSISAGLAQSVFRIDSLPEEGIKLNKNWKFHLGDDPAWAKPDFDDSRWDTINPVQDISTLDKLPQQGIGWLRIRLHIAPKLLKQAVAINILQIGATEVFLNGQLTGLSGKINGKKQIEVGTVYQYSPFVRLSNDSLQVFAVRYAFSTKRLIGQPHTFFRLKLLIPEIAEMEAIKKDFFFNLEMVLFGLFLALGTLQLLLYKPANEQQATLYFGLFLLIQSIVHLMDVPASSSDSLSKSLAINQVILFKDFAFISFAISIVLSSFFYLLGSYHYFCQPKKTLFYLTAAITLISILFSLILHSAYWYFSLTVLGTIIPFIDILRVGIVAVQEKKAGARLFTMAHAFTLFVYTAWTLITLFPTSATFLYGYRDYIFAMSFIALALTISFLLAQERVAAYKLLRKQFVELEALSQKTLIQEQEKQNILANQNELLEQQVEARTAELKASQAQLIQKEKLASLGELTAGIAHEIQNPLNFVNNFSEVSSELIGDLVEELDRGDTVEAKAIAGFVSQNLQKIYHHGGRAAAIVRGMLEHSRTDSGERRPTDLNALAEEYLKIAYNGLKAKDKTLDCALTTEFDPDLGRVEVVPQEIGRVLLNLYNNAFYAVWERAKQGEAGYQPTVQVSTNRTANGIEIRVRDNGTGISDAVKTKIFQPFFTTKPTGEGTGLGLSLSYDIVTKGYGGTLSVESADKKGTEFMITLPVG